VGKSRRKKTDTGDREPKVSLSGPKITDAALVDLLNRKDVKIVHLTATRVSDAGLSHLRGFAQAAHTRPHEYESDGSRAIPAASPLAQLRTLGLYGTQATDAGLAHLQGLTQLRSLDLRGTQATDAGLAVLEKADQARNAVSAGSKNHGGSA